MTIEEVQDISDDELRIKVAELCGWSIKRELNGELSCKYKDLPSVWCTEQIGVLPAAVPNYPQDLNAMHEACKSQNTHQGWNYDGPLADGLPRSFVMWLDDVVHSGCAECEKSTYGLITATARQRAEAFVLTVSNGGWE